jgi:hypothetical protein
MNINMDAVLSKASKSLEDPSEVALMNFKEFTKIPE